MPDKNQTFLFCDLETTGLDAKKCEIIEIAAILTKGPADGFEEIDRYEAFVRLSDCAQWGRFALEMHQKSGLLADYDDRPKRTLSAVRNALRDRTALYQRPIFAARNPHFDRAFIRQHLPDIDRLLHYRQFDVNTLCVVDPTLYDYDHGVTGAPHRAMYDIERDLEYAREFVRRVDSAS